MPVLQGVSLRRNSREGRRAHLTLLRLAAVVATLGLGLTGTPAVNAGTDPLLLLAGASRWEGARAEAFDRLERTRELVSSGNLVDAVQAAASLAGVSAHPAPAPSADVPAGLPWAIADPLGKLLGAVDTASSLARGSLRAPLESAFTLREEAAALVSETQRLSPILASGSPETEELEQAGRQALTLQERGDALLHRVEETVDRQMLYSGALLLAQTLDQVLPRLEASPRPSLAPGAAAIGCDVVDEAPVLCVGGEGKNTYEDDYALLVDLGGDDLYTNSAGGGFLGASVVVDLGGNDRYETTLPIPRAGTSPGLRVAQGGGDVAGIGILIDTEGDDAYSVESIAPEVEPGLTHGAWAQGYGEIGVGILADLEGNDAYRIANRSHSILPPGDIVPAWREAMGQGWASLGGLGLALDSGGEDTYLLESRPELFMHEWGLSPGAAYARGFGAAAAGGAAIFADEGGDDSMTIRAQSAPIAPDDPRPLSPELAQSWTGGFGWGALGGAGVSLTGPGALSGSIEASVAAPQTAFAGVEGFGYGELAGYGAHGDAGGDDRYVTEAVSHGEHRVTIHDACGCQGASAQAVAGWVRTATQGLGISGGVGVLHDASGNDRYLASAQALAEAEARDGRVQPHPPDVGVQASADTQLVEVLAQGVGGSGGGFVEDESGDDAYEARGSEDARARASASLSDTPTSAAAANAFYGHPARVLAQGVGAGGYGEIRDVGGADSYLARSAVSVTADPPTVEFPGETHSSAQGSVEAVGSALLSDTDGGAEDSFKVDPEDPTCQGTRGEGVWVDCAEAGAAVGVNE